MPNRKKTLEELRKRMADASKIKAQKHRRFEMGKRATGPFPLAEIQRASEISSKSKIPKNKEIATIITKFHGRGQRGSFEPTPEMADAMIRVTKKLLRAEAQKKAVKLTPIEEREFRSLENL